MLKHSFNFCHTVSHGIDTTQVSPTTTLTNASTTNPQSEGTTRTHVLTQDLLRTTNASLGTAKEETVTHVSETLISTVGTNSEDTKKDIDIVTLAVPIAAVISFLCSSGVVMYIAVTACRKKR